MPVTPVPHSPQAAPDPRAAEYRTEAQIQMNAAGDAERAAAEFRKQAAQEFRRGTSQGQLAGLQLQMKAIEAQQRARICKDLSSSLSSLAMLYERGIAPPRRI